MMELTSTRNEDRDYETVDGNDTGHDHRNERLDTDCVV